MKKLIRGLARPNTFLPLVFIGILGYLGAAQIIPQNTLAIIINGVFIAACVMINAAYGPGLIRSLRSDREQNDQFLITGILVLWNAIAGSRVWSLALIIAGKPAWMINHWFPTFCYFVAAMTGFYFLKIAGVSRVGYRYTTAAVALAAVLASVVLAFFQP